jgi:hypothetical protein
MGVPYQSTSNGILAAPPAAQWIENGSAGRYLTNNWDERSVGTGLGQEEITDRELGQTASPASPTPSDASVLSEYAEVARPFDTGGQHIGVSSWNVNGPEFTDLWIQELYTRLSGSSIDVLFC